MDDMWYKFKVINLVGGFLSCGFYDSFGIFGIFLIVFDLGY